MEKQFIPYELALKLKELGFNEECGAYYSPMDNILSNIGIVPISSRVLKAPLWQQAFDWFRLHKKLSAELTSWYGVDKFWKFEIFEVNNNNRENLFPVEWSESNEYHKEKGTSSIYTYEEARQACLEKLIELCKK